MSTQPDPHPPYAEVNVRRLLDDLIRTAAPRLGKTAVARIAVPLTDAVIALRAEMLAEAEARVAAAFPPVKVGEVITSPERLAQIPDTALVRDADSIAFEKSGPLDDDPDVWAMPGGEGRYRPSLPVRVLDLGVSS